MRSFTVEAFPDVTGWAPREASWHACDVDDDLALDAAKYRVVGHGATPEEALANYDDELEEHNQLLRCMP